MLPFRMQAAKTVETVCKCASSSEPWLSVAYDMDSSLTFKLLANQLKWTILINYSVCEDN